MSIGVSLACLCVFLAAETTLGFGNAGSVSEAAQLSEPQIVQSEYQRDEVVVADIICAPLSFALASPHASEIEVDACPVFATS